MAHAGDRKRTTIYISHRFSTGAYHSLLRASGRLGLLLRSVLLPQVSRVQKLTRSVRKADKIAVVADGVSARSAFSEFRRRLLTFLLQTVTEFGSHAELMALEGRYHELFTLQQNEWKD